MRFRIETINSHNKKHLESRRKKHAEPREWLAWYPIRVEGENGYYDIVWLSFVQRRWDKAWLYNLGDNQWRRGEMLFGPERSDK